MRHLSEGINIGVSDIFFTPESTGLPIFLGLTKDGVTLKYDTNWHEITSDQTGTTPLDDIMIGETVTAKVKVLDTSKQKIAALLPSASAFGPGSAPDFVTFGQRPGLRATHFSGKLLIHPISMGDDTSNDVTIYRTANTGSLELAFKLDDEWVIPCVFKGYYDDFRMPGDQLFRIGADSPNQEIYRRVILFWIAPSNPVAPVGGSVTFSANAMFEDGSQEDVTSLCSWISSDPATVSLTPGPVLTAAASLPGSVVIRAEYIGYSCSTSMTIS